MEGTAFMSVLYIMIPSALLLAGLGIFGFILAVKSGQFDDLDTPALRAVFEDDDTTTAQSSKPDLPSESGQESTENV